MARRFGIVAGLAMAFVLLLAINLLAGLILHNVKLDLTKEKLYTLSSGSKSLMAELKDNIKLKLYYSKRVGSSMPQIALYSDRIIELLKQYQTASKGKITVEVLDPKPDTDLESEATKYGIKGVPLQGGAEVLYFGLAIASDVGQEESIPFLDPQREAFIEYDLTRLISSVANPEKKTIGIMSPLAIMGGPGMDPMARMQRQRQPGSEPWVFVQELKRQYKVETVSPTAETIDPKIDVLMVIHPKQVPPATEYAIDQYIMHGGRAILMVDPLCVYDQVNFQNPDPNARFQANFDSNLPKLFAAWGLEMTPAKVAGDLNLATELGMAGGKVQRHPAFLSLTAKQCNKEEIISSGLENMIIGAGGVMKKKGDSAYQMTPLLQTTTEASELDAFLLKFGSDADQIARDFKPGNEALPLALKLAGKFKTAFPAGKPASPAPPPEGEKPPVNQPHLAEAEKENTVLIVADVDMLADDFSVRKQNLFGQTLAMAINDNLAFMNNAVENMLGSQELISLRTRGTSRRPFTTVSKIENDAQKKFKAEEDELMKRQEETNQKIRELESGKDKGGRAILSAEQMDEVDNFRQQLADTKSKLREVRRNLRQDIESLGVKLKFLNIALMPILILLAGLFLPPAWRSYQARSSSNG